MALTKTIQQHRILWVDLFKGILMLMIILSHTGASEIYRRFYTPVFLSGYFWISGYMSKSDREFKQFIVAKLRGLIIPFLSLGIINSLISIVVEHDSIGDRMQFLLSRRLQWDDLWFVSCMFSAQCIFWIVEKVCISFDRRKTKKYWSALLLMSFIVAMVGLYYTRTINIPLPFQFENACINLLFITFGYTWKFFECKITISVRLFGTLNCVIYLLIVCLFENKVDVHSAQYGVFLQYMLSAVTGIFALTVLCKECQQCMRFTYLTKIGSFIGQNTLVYYAFQSKAIKVFKEIASIFLSVQDVYILPIAITILTAAVLAIPAFLMNRFLPVLIGKKIYNTVKL